MTRQELIEDLEAFRGSKVICYATSTRPDLPASMSMDVIPVIFEHLSMIDTPPQETTIDLLLHSDGGDGVVPWRLVTLLREYCKHLAVLIPDRAFSAATLTALGADEVLMHPMGMLGPIDPTVSSPYGPTDPRSGMQLGISVEDVAAYIALIKEDVGIHHEDELVQAFLALANKEAIHPLALGSVKRSTSQARMLGRRLLQSRQAGHLPEHEIEEVLRSLTSELYYHGHPINRHEAREELGLSFVQDAPDALAEKMWAIFQTFVDDMKLREPFVVTAEVSSKVPLPALPPPGVPISVVSATLDPVTTVMVESARRADAFEMLVEGVVRRHMTGQIEGQASFLRVGWRRLRPKPEAPLAPVPVASPAVPASMVGWAPGMVSSGPPQPSVQPQPTAPLGGQTPP